LARPFVAQEGLQHVQQGRRRFAPVQTRRDQSSLAAGYAAVRRQHDDGEFGTDAPQQTGDQEGAAHVAIEYGRLNGIGEQRVQSGLDRANNNHGVTMSPQPLDTRRQGIGLVVDTEDGRHAGQ